MTYQLKFTTTYKKSYKLMKKRGLDITLLNDVVDQMRQGKQLDEKYHDHGLSGNFAGFRECHIKPDWLLVYLIENDVLTLTLVDTGSHSDMRAVPYESRCFYLIVDSSCRRNIEIK